MERLESLAWAVVKREVLKEEKVAIKDMLKAKKEKTKTRRVVELAMEVGWLDKIKRQWKIETKKEMWRDIHRDIVST